MATLTVPPLVITTATRWDNTTSLFTQQPKSPRYPPLNSHHAIPFHLCSTFPSPAACSYPTQLPYRSTRAPTPPYFNVDICAPHPVITHLHRHVYQTSKSVRTDQHDTTRSQTNARHSAQIDLLRESRWTLPESPGRYRIVLYRNTALRRHIMARRIDLGPRRMVTCEEVLLPLPLRSSTSTEVRHLDTHIKDQGGWVNVLKIS